MVGGGQNDDGTGGCNPPVAYSGPADAANKFFDTFTKVTPATGSMCAAQGSTKCQSSAGTCGFNKGCKNWFRDVDDFCYCGCP
jgi:hypothetical protein